MKYSLLSNAQYSSLIHSCESADYLHWAAVDIMARLMVCTKSPTQTTLSEPEVVKSDEYLLITPKYTSYHVPLCHLPPHYMAGGKSSTKSYTYRYSIHNCVCVVVFLYNTDHYTYNHEHVAPSPPNPNKL